MDEDIREQVTRLQAEVTQQQQRLAQLETEVAELDAELSEFRQRYDRVVGPAATRLDAMKEAVEELERQRYLDNHIAQSGPLKSSWTPPEGYVSVEEQYRRVWQQRPDDLPPRDSINPVSDRRSVGDLKGLYHRLARRYHPDLASDATDREQHNTLMRMINEAYEAGDVDALLALAEHPEDARADVPLAALSLRQLHRTYAQLEQRIAELQRLKSTLAHDDLLRLKVEDKLAQRQGRDLLREIADRLEEEYYTWMARLEQLRGGQR